MPTKMAGNGSKRSDSDSDTIQLDVDEQEDDQEEEETESTEQSEEDSSDDDDRQPIQWTGYGKRIPVLIFKADAIVSKRPEIKAIGEKYHLAFKIVKTECKLVRSIMTSHGFHEAHPNSMDFNLMWSGSHLKPYELRSLMEFQKVNHFPRSYEITRKDRLFKNIQRMQQTKGFKHFDFIPPSFIVPGEFQDFCTAYLKDKGPWIVKPIASSRGRGIFLVNHPEQVPLDDTMIVCKYLANPLLIDGFKFDVRLYVAVTSYDPLVIYLYEEGLTRFATVKYEKTAKSIRNSCMHLTNYSVNKKSHDYVKNDDPDVEDYGNKWSLGAMLRYLRSQGRDTTAMMMRIEDVIIKTLLSAELPIATACKMFMPFRGNCFEVYGFDILLDENLRPWVLEVNLSPSLACDSPLDLKIKSNMLSDLFSLVGFICHDPMVRKSPNKRSAEVISKAANARAQVLTKARVRATKVFRMYTPNVYTQKLSAAVSNRWNLQNERAFQGSNSGSSFTPLSSRYSQAKRPASASQKRGAASATGLSINAAGLSGDEIRMVRRAKEEFQRRGGWMRIFPSPDSWELYSSYMQFSSNNNLILWQQLFPERARNTSHKPTTASYSSGLARAKSVHLHSAAYPQLHVSSQDDALAQALARSLQYERKLSTLGQRQRRKPTQRQRAILGAPNLNGSYKGSLVQGVEETSSEANVSAKRNVPKNTRPATKEEVQAAQAAQEKQEKERTSPPPPPPPSKPQQQKPAEPKYNVVQLLEKGKTMSKVQARFAFATYLSRVQQRLMVETGGSGEQDDVDQANEQMDLVLRFLKRAAGNLQQPFKVVVPSRKLPINDRRRILAKQLGDFVHIYNKETEQLRQRNKIDEKHLKRPPSFSPNDGLDEHKFNRFVAVASENELEEVLTTYTKLNKSASIFLGSNAKSSASPSAAGDRLSPYNTAPAGDASSAAPVSGQLSRRKPSSVGSVDSVYRGSEGEGHSGGPRTISRVTSASSSHHHHNHHLPDSRPSSGTVSSVRPPSGASSYVSAVSVYSTKLSMSAGSLSRGRPASAAASGAGSPAAGSAGASRPISAYSRLSGSTNKSRPGSANVARVAPNPRPASAQRERPDGAETSADQYDEEAINAALSRIALRQQQRQYSSTNKPPVIDAQLAGDMGSNNSIHSQVRGGANETFESFVADAYYSSDDISNGGKKPTYHSSPYQMQQQQQLVKQQRMMDQSKALLESSKAKHQAMVAQAHAAHKSRQQVAGDDTETAMQVYAPKPPMGNPPSERKVAAAHRMARKSTMEGDDLYNMHGNFYSRLKYDNSTDTIVPLTGKYSYQTGY